MNTKVVSLVNTVNKSTFAINKDVLVVATTGDPNNKATFEEANAGGNMLFFMKPFQAMTVMKEISEGKSGQSLILVTEDDPMISMMWPRFIEVFMPDAKVIVAVNPVEGLEMLKEEGVSPDIIITDHDMPMMSGSEFLANIRSGKYN